MEPTNRELKIMLDHVTEKFEEKHKDVMEMLVEIRDDGRETKKQATYTNGKVAKLIWWKNSFIWALGALWALLVIAFPVLRWAVHQDIKETTHDTIQASLSEFNITVK